MSKADEMFEKLGFKKIKNDGHSVYLLKYYKNDDNVIYFYEDTPNWGSKGFIKSGEFDGMCENITMQELQAINEKVKELGWNE